MVKGMVNIKKEMNRLNSFKEFVALATVPAKDYQKANLDMIKHFTDELDVPGIYFTLNKPYSAMLSHFRRAKIDTRLIIFIDAITMITGANVKKQDNCLFIGSPENLSDISIAMDQAVRSLPGNNKFLFFDSLNTLLIYNNVETVVKFIHFLAGKMRVWKVKGIIISLKKKSNDELIDELTQFCDITFDFGGKK